MNLNIIKSILKFSLYKIDQYRGGFYDSIPEDLKDIIDILEPLNIEARYPSQKDKLFSELTEERCNRIISYTEVLYRWTLAKFMKD